MRQRILKAPYWRNREGKAVEIRKMCMEDYKAGGRKETKSMLDMLTEILRMQLRICG